MKPWLSLAACCLFLAPLLAQAQSEKALLGVYAHTPGSLTVKAKPQENKDFHVEHLEFKNSAGETVTGLFGRPKAPGKYPLLLLLHGYTSSKEQMAMMCGISAGKEGFCVLALDAKYHGERKSPDGKGPQFTQFAEIVKEGILNYRQVLDYAVKRPDVDGSRIGLEGYSMGAMMGTILMAVEPRVKSGVLYVGGDIGGALANVLPEKARQKARETSPAAFAPYIKKPVLFVNGTKDELVRKEMAERVHKAASEPKEIRWVEAGHMLPGAELEKGAKWLAGKVK